MSLNKLEDALHGYYNDHRACLGLPTSLAMQKTEATERPTPEFVFKMSNLPENPVRPKAESFIQPEQSEELFQRPHQSVVDSSHAYQSQSTHPSNQTRKVKTQPKAKKGINFILIFMIFIFMTLGGIGYAIYDVVFMKEPLPSAHTQSKIG